MPRRTYTTDAIERGAIGQVARLMREYQAYQLDFVEFAQATAEILQETRDRLQTERARIDAVTR